MMKKIISAALVLVMLLTMLASCDAFVKGGSLADTTEYDGTVYSPSVSVKIIRNTSTPDYVGAGYTKVYDTLNELGVDAMRSTDDAGQMGSEIALGNTNRAASSEAKTLVDEKYVDGNITFAIVYKKGVLAVYAADELSFSEAIDYLVLNYLTSNTLKVETDHTYSVSMSEEEYKKYLDEKAEAELLAGWDNRFDYLTKYMSSDAVEAVKRFYGLFDENVYLWLANLWDNETGAFYYAGSSRDYEGFLPDVESTTQAIKMIAGSGMIDSYGGGLDALDAGIPEEMQEKIINFVFSLYCDDDGYFYHEQWGRNISDDRKGRDLTWSLQLIKYFGETLPDGWVDAVTRLKNQNASTSAAVSRVLESSVRPTASSDRFASRENFKAYLDSLNLLGDSYGTGHQLASQADQIGAAGLLDYCCDYLDALQEQIYEEQIADGDTPTGLWEKKPDYHGISGFFKINVVYSAAKRTPKYLDYALRSCVECILSDEDPGQITYTYNPWAALGECIGGMRRANAAAGTAVYNLDSISKSLFDEAEEMFIKTTEKSELFRQSDGGYSYFEDNSSSSIQGVYASRGYAEGDVNATCLLVYHTVGYMEGALGIQLPAIWNSRDYQKFLETIDNLDPVEKKKSISQINCDFEKYTVGSQANDEGIFADGGSLLKVEVDPNDSSNQALLLSSLAGVASGYKIRPNFTKIKNCFVFEADFNMTEKSSGTTHQISIYTGSDRYYMLTFSGNTETVAIGDSSNVNSTYTPNGKVNPINQNFGVSVPVGEWFKLRLEIYDQTDDGFKVKIFVNDEYVYTSSNYFGKELGTECLLEGAVTSMWIYNLISASAQLYADNIQMYYSDMEYVEGAGAGTSTEIYDFESNNVKAGGTLRSTDAKDEIITATDKDGNDSGVYHFSKTSTNTWDQLYFKMPTEKDEGSVITVSMDICFNSFSGAAQLAFGGLDANSYYLLCMNSNGSTVSLYDASTMKTGVAATKTEFAKTLTVGRWHTLEFEFYVTERSSDFEVTIYIDGTRIGTSKNYYNYNGESGATPNILLDVINMRFVSAAVVDVYIDNVSIVSE